MNWLAPPLDAALKQRLGAAGLLPATLLIVQSAMCDGRVPTSFFIQDIISSDDKAYQRHLPESADHDVPVVVRPWEMQTTSSVTRGGDALCARLTAAAAALTLWHWQAVNSVSPLCALYKMTASNFVDSLNGDRLQGSELCN